MISQMQMENSYLCNILLLLWGKSSVKCLLGKIFNTAHLLLAMPVPLFEILMPIATVNLDLAIHMN